MRYDNIKLRFNVTMTAKNQHHAGDVIRFVRHELRCAAVNLLVVRGDIREPELKEIDAEAYREAIRLLWNDSDGRRGLLESLMRRRNTWEKWVIAERLGGAATQLRCMAGRRFGILSETGNVFPCELQQQSFGGLLPDDVDFADVWNGPAARAFRARQTPACEATCTFETGVGTSIVYSPSFLLKILMGEAPI